MVKRVVVNHGFVLAYHRVWLLNNFGTLHFPSSLSLSLSLSFLLLPRQHLILQWKTTSVNFTRMTHFSNLIIDPPNHQSTIGRYWYGFRTLFNRIKQMVIVLVIIEEVEERKGRGKRRKKKERDKGERERRGKLKVRQAYQEKEWVI